MPKCDFDQFTFKPHPHPDQQRDFDPDPNFESSRKLIDPKTSCQVTIAKTTSGSILEGAIHSTMVF